MDTDWLAVANNIRHAETIELLDRVTVYRTQMEPAAVALIEKELSQRGISENAIAEHECRRWETALLDDLGRPVRCHECDQPAVVLRRGWYRVYRRLPIFPRTFAFCEEHRVEYDSTHTPAQSPAESEDV